MSYIYCYIVDVDGLFYVCKMVKIHHKCFLVTSLIFILKFQRKWIRFIMIWKIKLKIFQINLMLKLFMFLMLELLKLFKLLFIKSNLVFVDFFFFWQFFLLFTFFLEFALFFPFFPPKKCQVKKIQNQTHMLVGRGGESKYFISSLFINK